MILAGLSITCIVQALIYTVYAYISKTMWVEILKVQVQLNDVLL